MSRVGDSDATGARQNRDIALAQAQREVETRGRVEMRHPLPQLGAQIVGDRTHDGSIASDIRHVLQTEHDRKRREMPQTLRMRI